MIEQVNAWGEAWAAYFGPAAAQNTVFLAVVLLALWLLRRAEARVRYMVTMAGFVKLLLPTFVPGPDLFPKGPTPGAVVIEAVMVDPSPLTAPVVQHTPHLSLVGVFFLLWVFGASIFLLLPLLHTLSLLLRLRAAANLPVAQGKADRGALRVYATPVVALPLSVGMRCRTVFVPPDWQRWPAQARELAMYHELAHASRADGWAQLLQVVARAIYFFHPLVWMLWRLAGDYREMACDDTARQAARMSPLEYSRQLQQLAEAAFNTERGVAGVAALVRERNKLLRRVQYQMEGRTMKKFSKGRVLAIVMSLALLALPLSFNCGRTTNTGGGRLKGFVVDADTGVRMAGVRISLVGTRMSARTNQEGEFTISNVPPGEYVIEAHAPGYAVGRVEKVMVARNAFATLAFNLTKPKEHLKKAPPESQEVRYVWGEPPEPMGGFGAIQERLRYPEEARKAGVEGRVYVIALIDTNGMVRHAYGQPDTSSAVAMLHPAALEAVTTVRWKPARFEGRPVPVQIGIPVIFQVKVDRQPEPTSEGQLPPGFSPFDEPPEAIGGFAAIQENVRYPEKAKEAGVEGKVYVIAVIDTNGRVEKAWVEDCFAPGLGLEQAAVAAVRATRFKPAKYRGKPAPAQIGIPVIFKVKGDQPAEPASEGQLPPISTTWDEPPEPIGGFAAIQAALNYPESVRKSGIEGRVYVIAVISDKGEVLKAWAQNFLGDTACDEAAIAAVKAVKWKPAKQQGEPVTVQIGIPVIFRLK